MVRYSKRTIRLREGYSLLMNIFSPYRSRIYKYNEVIKDSGYYLKPLHIVYRTINKYRVKYLYFGRYWYRVYKSKGKNKSKIRWIYIGRDKPDPHLPDPPINPFEGIAVIADSEDILVDEKTLNVLSRIAEDLANRGLIDLKGGLKV